MRSYDILILIYTVLFCIGTIFVGLTVFDPETRFLLPLACALVLFGLMQMDHYTIMKKLEPDLKIPEKEEKKP